MIYFLYFIVIFCACSKNQSLYSNEELPKIHEVCVIKPFDENTLGYKTQSSYNFEIKSGDLQNGQSKLLNANKPQTDLFYLIKTSEKKDLIIVYAIACLIVLCSCALCILGHIYNIESVLITGIIFISFCLSIMFSMVTYLCYKLNFRYKLLNLSLNIKECYKM